MHRFKLVQYALFLVAAWGLAGPAQARELAGLFLGDQGPHQPRVRFAELQPALAARGVRLSYTEDVEQLELENLRRYDVLVLYANIDRIDPQHAAALLSYVDQGGGFVPLHCATFCFRNSAEMVALMGAQFRRHGSGVFRTRLAQTDHPILRGFSGFESWDETYVHHLHNEKDRTVLAYRVDAEGREPWTWVRTHGEGRVFYTAWGHDGRTWRHPGFQNLVERGIRWAAKDDPSSVPDFDDGSFPIPAMKRQPEDLPAMEYVDVGRQIPSYPPSERWGVQDEPLRKMQKPLSPEQSMQHMVVPQGFHVELFAAEPDIGGKPLCMAWDERGRLWIAESYDYPNELQPSGSGRDRIRILEDTDGDWRADKFTVFAEDLSIPTSIAFHRGGAIVQNGGETLYLKDSNGDDAADVREVLFSGWGIRDTHGGVSNFQYGLDNWMWAMQGYNESRPVVRGEPSAVSFRQGFFRFRPDGSELEFLRSTNNNTWGLGISEEGLIFGSTANRNPSVFMPIPNRYYERVSGWTASLTLGSIADTHLFNPITDKVRQVDHHGGYTAGAGHALYTAREFPQEYWNRTAMVNGPTGHLVGLFVLQPDGAGFRSSNPLNLLASDDEWTAPIMAEVGPDGHVWMIDWYNFIVQHNPTPEGFETGAGAAYKTKLRDKRHGRIYRVVYENGRSPIPFSLAGATPEQLVAALSHPTMLWRKHAQRLLVERGQADVVKPLIRLVGDSSVDAVGLNVGAIHALWTMHGLGILDGDHDEANAAVVGALAHRSAGVRRNALQVLPPTSESTTAVLRAGLLDDHDAQVRLAACLALADLPPAEEAGRAIFARACSPRAAADRWEHDALVAAAANHSPSFLEASLQFPGQPADALLEMVRIVAQHYGRTVGPANAAPLLNWLAQSSQSEMVVAAIDGLASPASKANPATIPRVVDEALDRLFVKVGPDAQGQLVMLARRWGSQRLEQRAAEIGKTLLAAVDDPQLEVAARIRAARQLIRLGPADAQINMSLLDRISPQIEPEVARGLLESLRASRWSELGERLAERLSGFTPGQRETTVEVMLGRLELTRALLSAIESRRLHWSELSLDQKQLLASHSDPQVRRQARELLDRGGSLPSEDRQKVLQRLASVAQASGNGLAGKAVFKKHCAACHLHGGEGAPIGPDLTGMAAHPKLELLTHIIDPNRDVEGNYRVYAVRTTDGRTLSGLLASESNTMIELVDVKGAKHQLLREDVAGYAATGASLMPEGFENEINAQDLTDLLEFLTQRGVFRLVDIGPAATITSARGMFYDVQNRSERIVFDDWSRKTVHGTPFELIDPQDGAAKNAIVLHGPRGRVSKVLPKEVVVACDLPARTIHLLSGVSGWGYPAIAERSRSLVVRIRYADGEAEEHEFFNGEHFADYNSHVDVPQSIPAFKLGNAQLRRLAIHPRRREVIRELEFAKGDDATAPIIMAVTFELP